jgi:RNA polymerase sigma-70 factor (ECF subfamily)
VNRSISADNFHEVVRAFGGYVYTIAYRLLGNSADAEDAAQETFIKAYRRLNTFDEERGLKNWLCTIALNTARDFHRRSSRRRAAALFDGAEKASAEGNEPTASINERIDAEKLLSMLDINYRSVMMLYYMEQRGVREIAAMMKKSESVVKVWLFRARKILLEKYGEGSV